MPRLRSKGKPSDVASYNVSQAMHFGVGKRLVWIRTIENVIDVGM